MKRVYRSLVLVLLAAGLLVFTVGCDNPTGDDNNSYNGPTGTVSGTVRDATNGSGVDGATVSVVGYNQFDTTSGNGGGFSITSPVGDQTIRVTLSGYTFAEVPVSVLEGEETPLGENETVGSPGITAGQLRIVLTWGEVPSDLDSHLWTPNGKHVYWVDQTPTDAGANLDVDDVDSFGPETITITAAQSGTYYYYVHNWSGTPDLTVSNAKVVLYDANGIVQTFTVPTSGSGDYWNIMTFELAGDTINPTVVDEIQAEEPGPS